MPGSTHAAAFLEDDEVVAFIALDKVNGHAHACFDHQSMNSLQGASTVNGELPDMPAPMMTTDALV